MTSTKSQYRASAGASGNISSISSASAEGSSVSHNPPTILHARPQTPENLNEGDPLASACLSKEPSGQLSFHPPMQELGADELPPMPLPTEVDADPGNVVGLQVSGVPLHKHRVILGHRGAPLQGHEGLSQGLQEMDQQCQVDVLRARRGLRIQLR